MRSAIACAVLAGCIPVSFWTAPGDIKDAASTLRQQRSASIQVDEIDDGPPDQPSHSWVDTTESVRLDEPIRVRLTARAGRWGQAPSEPLGAEQAMTVADLFVDCPDDLDNSEATRRAYPRCRLFRSASILLRHGHRPNLPVIVVTAGLVAAAADVACIVECGPGGSRASKVALGVGGGIALVAAIVYMWNDLATTDVKHGYGHR